MSGFGDINRVNTNVQSLDAQLSLNKINKNLSDNQLRLSTGLRINRAEDDSAGFSIATKLNSRVAGLNQAMQNVGDAKSVLDIAEASFDTIMDNLIEMKSLATQAANDTLGDTERAYISEQIAQLGAEINDIANQTVYQDLDLLNGNPEGDHDGSLSLTFQTGERAQDTISTSIDAVNINQLFASSSAAGVLSEVTDDITGVNFSDTGTIDLVVSVADGEGDYNELLSVTDVSATDMNELADVLNSQFSANGLNHLSAESDGTDITITSTDITDGYQVVINDTADSDATATLAVADINLYSEGQGRMDLSDWDSADFRSFMADVDSAIESMADRVNAIGITQSSLSTRELTLSQAISSNTSAASRIMDADFAKEQSESIRLQILQQTATSALAQANMGPQSVLGFLG